MNGYPEGFWEQPPVKINARTFLSMLPYDMMQFNDVPYEVTFDDGEVVTTDIPRLVYSRFLWEIVNKYPKTPLLKTMLLSMKERITMTTHLDIMAKIMVEAEKIYDYVPGYDPNEMNRVIYQITNHLHNHAVEHLGEYITSISILDYVAVTNHPEVKASKALLIAKQPGVTADDIAAHHRLVTKLLNSPAFATNGLAKEVKSKFVDSNQVLQNVGCRGFCVDADFNIFGYALVNSFTEGMPDLPSAIIESRSSTVASYMARDPMQDSEYANRQVQILAASLSTIHPGDCGSKHLMPYAIDTPNKLRDLDGIFFEDEVTNTIRPIDCVKDIGRLVGKIVNIRNVAMCEHPDSAGVCATCFGTLAKNIPKGTNIGWASAGHLLNIVSQSILSIKHILGTSNGNGAIRVDSEYLHLLRGKAKGNYVWLSEQLDGKEFSIEINAAQAAMLNDVMHVDNLDMLNPASISSLSRITFNYTNRKHQTREDVPVLTDKKIPFLSLPLLKHIKKTGYTVTPEGDYHVDMTGWDNRYPFLTYPIKEENSNDYRSLIENMIMGTNSKINLVKPAVDYETTAAALAAFHTLVSTKFNVSFSHLQIILCAFLTTDKANGDYTLPSPKYKGRLAKFNDIMKGRSLAAVLAHEDQKDALFSIGAFINQNRQPHLFDPVIG